MPSPVELDPNSCLRLRLRLAVAVRLRLGVGVGVGVRLRLRLRLRLTEARSRSRSRSRSHPCGHVGTHFCDLLHNWYQTHQITNYLTLSPESN